MKSSEKVFGKGEVMGQTFSTVCSSSFNVIIPCHPIPKKTKKLAMIAAPMLVSLARLTVTSCLSVFCDF